MRKLTFLTALVIFLNVSLKAQDNFRFGLHLSPNIGWINPDNVMVKRDGGSLGFSYGLIAEFNLSERYAIATGLNILKIKGTNTITSPIATSSFEVMTQYVEIPLTLKLKTNEIGYLTYFGKFGLGTGVNIKARQRVNDVEIDYKSETQPLRLALIVGIGTEFNIAGNTSLIFGLDFNNGFTNIYTKKAGTDANGEKLRGVSNYIALNLGVCF